MNKNNNGFLINFLLIVAIIGIVALIVIFPENEETATLRIGAGDDMAGSILKKVLSQNEFDFEIETYYLKDCWAPTAQWSLKSNVYDVAMICTDAADKFIEASDDFVLLGTITENTDVLIKKDNNVKKIGLTSNKDYLSDFIREKYADAEIEYMSPHSFGYAYESGQIDGYVIDIGLINSNLEGEIENVSDGDYGSNVIIANRKILKDKKFKEFLDSYNKMVLEYNKNPNPNYFEFKFGKDERRKEIWKVKLRKIDLKQWWNLKNSVKKYINMVLLLYYL